MKVRINIYSVYTNQIIATIETSAKNIKSEVYHFIERNFDTLKINATETYYRFK